MVDCIEWSGRFSGTPAGWILSCHLGDPPQASAEPGVSTLAAPLSGRSDPEPLAGARRGPQDRSTRVDVVHTLSSSDARIGKRLSARERPGHLAYARE